MQTANNAKAVAETQCVNTTDEPLKLRSRIGSTVYEVNVYFNKDGKETMDDIILRILGNNNKCYRRADCLKGIQSEKQAN